MIDQLEIDIANDLTEIDFLAYKIGFCGPNECERIFELAEQIRKAVMIAKERLKKGPAQ